MAEIPLGDYAGYIFTEMVRAREIGDRYSRALADRYAADDIMRHFSVPRFKIPKMQLTIPVLITDAAVRQLARFYMPEVDFVDLIIGRVEIVRDQMDLQRRHDPSDADVRRMARELHTELTTRPDPADTNALIASTWPKLLKSALRDDDLLDTLRPNDAHGALIERTTAEIADIVRKWTTIEPSRIDGLMVDPVTHAVREGSSDSTVFIIAVEMMEDGFYLRSITDARTGDEQPIVEFD